MTEIDYRTLSQELQAVLTRHIPDAQVAPRPGGGILVDGLEVVGDVGAILAEIQDYVDHGEQSPGLCRAGVSERLARLGVPVERWGKGEAKTVDHLIRELRGSESTLVMGPDGLCRHVYGAHVLVTHGEEVLMEHMQVFLDGRQRKRNLVISVGEKADPQEDPRATALRAFSEELAIDDPSLPLTHKRLEHKTVASESFPGLTTVYQTNLFTCELPDRHYVAEGYREVQPDKTTTWLWKPIGSVPTIA